MFLIKWVCCAGFVANATPYDYSFTNEVKLTIKSLPLDARNQKHQQYCNS